MRLRSHGLAIGLVLALGPGCAARSQPYRFSSPLLGAADVPDAPLPGVKPASKAVSKRRAAPVRVAGGWQADAQQGSIRTVSAHGIEAKMPVASAEAADAVVHGTIVWSRLPAPHRGILGGGDGGLTGAIHIPTFHEPSDLRQLVGVRDKRDPYDIVLGWLADVGIDIHPPDQPGEQLVSWAQTANRLGRPTDATQPGDLLVFDRAIGESNYDLVGVVIARDARGVTEFMYAGGGVIRRGFLDPTRASSRRDVDGAILNTFLRHGKQWPPKGTRYLAGELLSHVIHTR